MQRDTERERESKVKEKRERIKPRTLDRQTDIRSITISR